MDDRDFLDVMYQGWTKTTGAETTFWMQEEDEYYAAGPGTWNVWAVGQGLSKDIDAVNDEDSHRKFIGSLSNEEDAAFITAVHGCFADLVRRMHTALDEADRLDGYADERTGEIAELAIENEGLREENSRMEGLVDMWEERVNEARLDASEANSYADSLAIQIVDLEKELEAATDSAQYWEVEARGGNW